MATAKGFWLPAELRRELDAIADRGFVPIARDTKKSRRAKLVQEWLSLNGHAVAIDSGFGPATEAAVVDFQRKLRLGASGTVDARTFEALVEPMVAALAPIAKPPAALGDAVIAVAKQQLAQHPREVGGENCGPWVRLYTNGNEGKDWPWCAGFVTFVLGQACAALDRKLPIAGSVSCDTLAAQAKEARRFVPERDAATKRPRPGSIFLVRRTSTDWTHTGLVLAAQPDSFKTVEGNTNDEGSREGYEVCARTRGYAEKDFIRID